MPEAATRVEFELRREALKERGIDTVEDYYAKRADLVHYLTHDWLRLTANKVDRENKNQSKARTLPLWNKIRKAFKRWAGEPPGMSLEPLPKASANVRNLMKQGFGVVQSAARYQGKEINTVGKLLEYAEEYVLDYSLHLKHQSEMETPVQYLLATTETNVRWYCCKSNEVGKAVEFELIDRLDLRKVSVFRDKRLAKQAAVELGLKTWRYVKF